MIDSSENERAALAVAGEAGGAFIERTGHTDLAQWSALQWTQFIDTIVTAYQDHLIAAHVENLPR